MRKKACILFSAVIAGPGLFAQMAFNTMDSININNINAAVLVHGDMWWNPVSQTAHARFPANAPTSINFAGSLWMSGYDAGNNLHIAAQTYRQDGNDYWPGPLNSTDTLTYATSHDWAKIWKVNKTDIQTFLSLPTHTTSNTPASILTWPGKGSAYAQGNAGASLTITDNMAPFADLNGNGNYEPLLGEYPDIRGDQALWWVFSDNGPAHAQTNGKPLGVEVHAMTYAYSRGTLIDNVVYYDYTVINKSPNNYHDVRMAIFDPVDLGFYRDDYVGFDSTWRMGICYNANNDDGAAGGHPANSYASSPPITGITMIVIPGDAGTSYLPTGAFTYYNNDNSIIGNPTVDTQYDNYMRAKIRNGQHFTKDPVSPGIPCRAYGAGPNTNYVYTADPSVAGGWSECGCNNNADDRRFILSSADFTLAAGTSTHMVMALVVTDTGEGGCGKPISYTHIKTVADTAWRNYFNHPAPNSISTIESNQNIRIYPNPAIVKITVELSEMNNGIGIVSVYNLLGQQMQMPINNAGNKYELDVHNLPSGPYIISYRNDNISSMMRFVKE